LFFHELTLTLSTPDDGNCRNMSCTLNLIYHALIIFEQTNCIDWINISLYTVTDQDITFQKSKTTAKLCKKIRSKNRSHLFWWCFLWNLSLYCYRFLPLLNMNGVAEKLYLGQWLYIAKYLSTLPWYGERFYFFNLHSKRYSIKYVQNVLSGD
jgi:hypothetical protein